MTLTEDIWRHYQTKGFWRNDLNIINLKKLLHLNWRMLKKWLRQKNVEEITTLKLKDFDGMTVTEDIWRHYQTKGIWRNDLNKINLKKLLHLNWRDLEKWLGQKAFQEITTLKLKEFEEMALTEDIWRHFQTKGSWRNDWNRRNLKKLRHLKWRNLKEGLRQKKIEEITTLKLKEFEEMT